MRISTSTLLNRLSEQMAGADMREIASVLGVSLATAYRYRKQPSDMSVAAFERIVDHFRIPVSMNLVYRENDVLAAEEARLKLEEEVAEIRGTRFVTTPHFTVNCEIEAFTREMFSIQYGDRFSDPEISEYVSLRMRRRRLYLTGLYKSEEVVNGPSYIDFFYGRGLFERVSKSVRKAQLDEVVGTTSLPHVMRKIYTKATPELPVILNYSNAKSIIRVEDLTMFFTDEDCEEANRVLRSYADQVEYNTTESVRSFFLNPLNPQKADYR